MFGLEKIRRAAAILLVCAIFLPLSECSQDKTKPPVSKTGIHRLFPQSDGNFCYQYAISTIISFGTDGAGGTNWTNSPLTLLAFTWPLAALFLGRKWPHSRFRWIVSSLELLFCAGTLYWLWVMTEGCDRLLYGAYLALLAILTYAGTTLFSLCQEIRRKNKTPGPFGPGVCESAQDSR